MSAPRFFTDEDVYAAVAPALRRLGFDAVSTPEVGRMGAHDDAQLAWAANEGRILLTFNVGHFTALHATWIQNGRSHAGIVVSSQRSIGDLLKRLQNLASALDADAMKNRLEFLGDW